LGGAGVGEPLRAPSARSLLSRMAKQLEGLIEQRPRQLPIGVLLHLDVEGVLGQTGRDAGRMADAERAGPLGGTELEEAADRGVAGRGAEELTPPGRGPGHRGEHRALARSRRAVDAEDVLGSERTVHCLALLDVQGLEASDLHSASEARWLAAEKK